LNRGNISNTLTNIPKLRGEVMAIDKNKVQPLDDEADTPMERANARVEAEMELLENETREQVAHGLQDQPLKGKGASRSQAKAGAKEKKESQDQD
jgi:hypothetical protein